jgi:hypothetical protein
LQPGTVSPGQDEGPQAVSRGLHGAFDARSGAAVADGLAETSATPWHPSACIVRTWRLVNYFADRLDEVAGRLQGLEGR